MLNLLTSADAAVILLHISHLLFFYFVIYEQFSVKYEYCFFLPSVYLMLLGTNVGFIDSSWYMPD